MCRSELSRRIKTMSDKNYLCHVLNLGDIDKGILPDFVIKIIPTFTWMDFYSGKD